MRQRVVGQATSQANFCVKELPTLPDHSFNCSTFPFKLVPYQQTGRGQMWSPSSKSVRRALQQIIDLLYQSHFYCLKLLEHLIYIKTSSLLSENNSLTSSQRGLRSKHSCHTQLLQVVKDWSSTINSVMTFDSQTFNSIARCMPDTTRLYTKQEDT